MSDRPQDNDRSISRRQALVGFGALAAAVFGETACGSDGTTTTAATADSPNAIVAASCILSPELTEGPYWISNKLTRRDITEGKAGTKLALYIDVIDAKTCEPVPGADVEIWHADARGVYSGFGGSSPGPPGSGPDNSKRFLRGHQKTNNKGTVRFDTIYPGWYPGRSAHVHVKVHNGGDVVHTGQIFFAEKTSRSVYRKSNYKQVASGYVGNGSDNIYAQAGGARARAKLAKRSSGGYRGEITLGIAT